MPPSARLTDLHACPAVTGTVPHVGGPILPPACPTVNIGGLPAARVTDLATCVGPPDTITQGAATVLIGGLPAARQTDSTMHGGAIIMGCPTVIIGGPSVVFPFTIAGAAPQRQQAQAALALLYRTATGKQIINGIAAGNHVASLEILNPGSGSFCRPANDADSRNPAKGADSAVMWDPTQLLPGLPANDPRSSAVVLGHELVHAFHNATGTNANGPNDHDPNQNGVSARGEERSTVGSAPPYDAAGNPINDAQGNPAGGFVRDPAGNFVAGPDYSHTSPTENSLRNDFGFPQRPTYYPPNWPGGPPW